MDRFFCLCVSVVFLLSYSAARGQRALLVSGNTEQPRICISQSNSDTGKGGELVRPALYLLCGDTAASFPVAGKYTAAGSEWCYQPLYPLAAGQRFLLRAKGYRDTVISIAAKVVALPAAPTAVAAFYPLSNSIPENILFFHIRFTQSMKEDREAWKKVTVADESGIEIPRTWRQRSFWLDSGRLLVLMIHPGRVKSGIHYTGPVFVKGHQYTLTVDSTMTDSYGRTMARTVSHPYSVRPEFRAILKTCEVTRKVDAGSSQPILIRFCNGVDHAAACTGILMYDAAGKRLACTVQQYEECTVSLQPQAPWPKGKLRLELAGDMYDCAGNRLNRLFEMKKKQTLLKDRLAQDFRISAE